MRRPVLALGIMLALVIISFPSLAHTARIHTSIRAAKAPRGAVDKGDQIMVFGRLKTAQDCRQGQTLQLLSRGPGADDKIDSDTTDAEGEFSFTFKASEKDNVYVGFAGSTETSYGHSHVCRKSKSRNLPVKIEKLEGAGGGGPGNSGGGTRCHSSYPDFCIPPPPPDLDCAQVNGSNFRVIGTDPHGFDGDNDGVGCET